MYAFEYHRPSSIKEAASLARKLADAKLIAGGQSMVPALKLRLARPTAMIDLNDLPELRGISVVGTNVVIGALTRHAEVAASKDVLMTLPVLAKVAAGIGDHQVRNMGTLGGAIANNDPAADYPAALLGLGATVTTNKRDIPADKFFTGMYETALKPGEIIASVSFPMAKRAAYIKFRNPASRFALVGVFVSETAGNVRVAVTGAAPCVFRVKNMEKALASKFAPEAIARIRVPADNLNSDLHAGAEYRSHLITVLAQRAVEAALSGK
ncbi:MAG: xanthine dehydrogenase family protein subunit M [Betaproteobacteria bacterium]|nr:xanthine dehydrogenase family protein subunit M [Betaproteobacteria bacterium]